MKIQFLWRFATLLFAAVMLGGCASSVVKKEDMELERRAKEQTIEMNQIKIDDACVTADAAAVAEALTLAGIAPRKSMSKAQEVRFLHYYEQKKPECMRGKDGASAGSGGRYGVTPKQLAYMSKAEECLRASYLLKTVEGKEAGMVAKEGSVIYHLEAINRDCAQWRADNRADYAVREYYRPRWFAPHPWTYQYHGRSYPYYQPGGPGTCPGLVCAGVTWKNHYDHSTYSGPPGKRRQELWKKRGLDNYGQHRRWY